MFNPTKHRSLLSSEGCENNACNKTGNRVNFAVVSVLFRVECQPGFVVLLGMSGNSRWKGATLKFIAC